MTSGRWFLTCVIFFSALLIGNPALGRDVSPEEERIRTKLAQRIPVFDATDLTFLEAFRLLARTYKIPIGIECVRSPELTMRLTLKFRAKSLEGIINGILRSQSGYGWRVDAGVIHIFNVRVLHDARNYLNLQVTEFSAEDKELPIISREFRDHVLRLMIRERPVAGWGGHTAIGAGEQKKLSIHAKDVTVRRVLNRLIAEHGEALWIVTFPQELPINESGFWAITLPDREVAPPSWRGLWLIHILSWNATSRAVR